MSLNILPNTYSSSTNKDICEKHTYFVWSKKDLEANKIKELLSHLWI